MLSWIFTHNMLSEAHRVWDFYILLFRCAFYCQTFEWICWDILAWWCSVNIHLNVPAQQTGHSDGHVDLMSRSLTATHPFNLMLIVTLWKQQLLTVVSVTLTTCLLWQSSFITFLRIFLSSFNLFPDPYLLIQCWYLSPSSSFSWKEKNWG